MTLARVVSLVPSSTETLLALGADVIACTKYCEQPRLVHVGGTKNPDIDAIVGLEPDVVVLDREENRLADHDALVAAGCSVMVSDVTDIDSALAVVDRLAAIAGVEAPSMRMLGVAERDDAPTAFVPIWRRPWMTISARTYGAALLDHIGIGLVDVGSDDDYPAVELDGVAGLEPDLVLVPSEPYVFDEEHVAELSEAMPRARIVRVDGQDLFWWGIRTPAAISRLAAALVLPPRH